MKNITEGFERNSGAEFKRFLDIAKASVGEVKSMLYQAEDTLITLLMKKLRS